MFIIHIKGLYEIVEDDVVVGSDFFWHIFKRDMDQLFLTKQLIKGYVDQTGRFTHAGPGHEHTQISRAQTFL